MISTQFLSVLLVLPASIFMLTSLVMSISMSKGVPDVLRTKWSVMTYLILFFMAGYSAFYTCLSEEVQNTIIQRTEHMLVEKEQEHDG